MGHVARNEWGMWHGRCHRVMAGLGPAIHDSAPSSTASHGWPAQGLPDAHGIGTFQEGIVDRLARSHSGDFAP